MTRKRLTSLDLQGNKLEDVANLDCLESLETLNLSLNDLKGLRFDNPMSKLRTLHIADNCLTYFDVTSTPYLRTLIMDRNAINQVKGLTTHRHLEIFSWREQDLSTPFDDRFQCCHNIRHLYLSSIGVSSTFKLEIPFLNLNTLEMSSMGLQSLPEEFGMMCRNIRILNLNYNAIHDIRPLLGITRLQRLCVAGNRLSRLRRTAAVLDRLSTELVEIDLRNNNLTVGFYTPRPPSGGKETRVIVHDLAFSCAHDEGDHEDESAKVHLLPRLDKDMDDISRERLDEDTKLRRRVYEMLLVSACKSLQRLDGLEVERSMVAKKDGVWERLVELDVLKAKTGREASM